MKVYSAKTLQEAIDLAAKAANVEPDKIDYEVTEEKVGLFGKIKSVTIQVFDTFDVVSYVENYARKLLDALDISAKIKVKLDDDTVVIEINSAHHNSALIGRQGATLEAFAALLRQAASQYFKKYVTIRLDICGYKAKRYETLERLAKIWGKNVLKTKHDLVLDPLPPDERRIVHQTLTEFKDLETKSLGEGRFKKLQIIYTGPKIGLVSDRGEFDDDDEDHDTND